jgi:hypothetical protein
LPAIQSRYRFSDQPRVTPPRRSATRIVVDPDDVAWGRRGQPLAQTTVLYDQGDDLTCTGQSLLTDVGPELIDLLIAAGRRPDHLVDRDPLAVVGQEACTTLGELVRIGHLKQGAAHRAMSPSLLA